MSIGEGQDRDALIQGGMVDDIIQLISDQMQLKKPEIVVTSENVTVNGSSPIQLPSNGTSSGSSSGAGTCEGAAQEALRVTNEYRAKHGVGPLELDPKISAKSQSWADDLERKKASLFDGKNLHSTRDNEGLYNSENLGETPTATASVNMFYNEIKDYDFNNQGQNSLAQGGKVVGHFVNMIWKNQKKMGVGCAKSGKPPNQLFVMNYLREDGGMGAEKENVLQPK